MVWTLSGAFINVGSSSVNPNSRGRIFKNFRFEYLPIPEEKETIERIPTYRYLGFTHVKYPDLPVHLDPEFETFTYGHKMRGFGDVRNLLKLRRDDTLFFYATLQREDDWFPYVIGYFRNLTVLDCRKMPLEEMRHLKTRGFKNNAHLKRIDPHIDLLIKGGEGSTLLNRAFPLAEDKDHSSLRDSFKDLIFTATGKSIKSGAPWFRWTLICQECAKLVTLINSTAQMIERSENR
jgi:hypothetical protein